MKTLITDGNNFPFDWADLEYLPNSKANYREIYTSDNADVLDSLMFLFDKLFLASKDRLVIYSGGWWDFCLQSWDIQNNSHDYNRNDLKFNVKAYYSMLLESDIKIGYSGNCVCTNWEKYLQLTLKCIIEHDAPYGHLICDTVNQYFFYFHHSASIGLYFKNENAVISKLLNVAVENFRIEER